MHEKLTELIAEKKYTEIRHILNDINSADIALLLEEFERTNMLRLFRLLPKDIASEVFTYLYSDSQAQLISAFNDNELRAVLSELYVDDTVDIIEEMPASVVTRILENSAPDTRREINELLNYPSESTGSVMTTEYVAFRENMDCDSALNYLRKCGIDKETIYTCYVTDKRKLIGVVTVKDILLAKENALIGDIMERSVISVSAYEDKETAARMFDKYDFLALPVVDKDNRLVGIVTVDDAIDVMRSESNEDFEVMAAITPTEKSYLKTGVFELVWKRIPWLLLLMLSSVFTSGIISSFEEALGVMPVLTAYIPMLMGTGGNAGGQSSVTIIRGLALEEISGKDIFRILWKESRVAVVCSCILSIVNFAKIVLFDKMLLGNDSITYPVAISVCLTLAVTVIAAKLIGCCLPVVAKKIKLDPAVTASPFITTAVDAIALVAYFKISVMLIEGLM